MSRRVDHPGILMHRFRVLRCAGSSLEESSIQRFIPPVVFQWPGFDAQPEHRVAALFIDVAGFTHLSESLATLGPEGAEILDQIIAEYFDGLLDVVEPFGGIPIKVSGDALMFVFPAPNGDLLPAISRTIACAAALQRKKLEISPVDTPHGLFSLAHKIGIGAGRLLSGLVGDPRLRLELAFAGSALETAVRAERHGGAGDVWLAPEVMAMLKDVDLPLAVDRQGFARLLGDPGSKSFNSPFGALQLTTGPKGLSAQETEAIIRRYETVVPATVREHANRGTLNYLTRHQHLAVLFAGCTGLEFDGPEALRKLDAHYSPMQQIIEQHGGHLSEFEVGDRGVKLIVLFGAPSMLEDPWGQAARCAWKMQDAARSLGVVEDQRIGLATGRLYVGRIGCRSLVKYSALGDRMNLAARLMNEAGPWTVLAERSVADHARQAANWGSGRMLKIRGKDELIAVCQLLSKPAGRGPDRRGLGIVGRALELKHFSEALESLAEGKGGVIELHGAPGIGKTRLIEAVRRMGRERGHNVVQARGSGTSDIQTSPLHAWRPLLLHMIHADETMSVEELEPRFRKWHASLPVELRTSATLLASLVGVPEPAESPQPQVAPERLLSVRKRSLIECVLQCARSMPCLMLLDAAERLDEPSIQVLTELAPALEELPLLVIVAHRPNLSSGGDPFPALRSLPQVRSLEIEPLSETESRRLIARRLKVQHLDAALVDLLQKHARGNPLLLESWSEFLDDRGHVRVTDNVAYLSRSEMLGSLPDRLETLILTQLEGLPPDAQLTIRVASVIGMNLTPADVVALHPEGLPERTIAAHLRLASQADLLWHDRDRPPWLFFSRSEVLEAIHSSLPFHLRRSLHSRRAQQLLAGLDEPASGDLVLQMARHHEYVEDTEAKHRYFALAMQVSQERCDHRGTVRWARRLIDVCEHLHDLKGVLSAFDPLQHALSQLGENDDRHEAIQSWIDEGERANDASSLVKALQVSALFFQRKGDFESSSVALERALSVARSVEGGDLLVEALGHASAVYGEAGCSQRALEVAEEGLRLPSGDDPERRFRILSARGFALHSLGRASEALRDFTEALKLSETFGDLWQQAELLGNISLQYWSMGQPEQGHATLVSSLELKRRIGGAREIATGLLNVGYSYFRLGDLMRARDNTEEAVRLFARLGYYRGELYATGNLGEIASLSNQLDDADHAYARAETLIARYPHTPLQIELLLRQGELALTRQDDALARSFFLPALEHARTAELVAFQCNAMEGLAEADLIAGRLDSAASWMTTAIEKLEAAGDQVVFPQRVWWRASRVAEARGESADSRLYRIRGMTLLQRELSLLGTEAARDRVIRGFPWNEQLIVAGEGSADRQHEDWATRAALSASS